MTKKWEYKYAVGNMSESDLNEYGQDGWELVGFRATGRDFESEFYFKRPIPEENIIPDGWKPWGGSCGYPDANVPVTILKRNGVRTEGKAGQFRWEQVGNAADIVAYKIGG